jgi:hypothetical protein
VRFKALLFLELFHPVSLFAMQAGAYGELSGVVRDLQALRVPEAIVTLTGSTVVGQIEAKSEGDGSYRFRALAPGTYALGATKAGFRAGERKGIALRTGDNLVIDFVLEPEGVTEELVVEAEAYGLDRRTSQVGEAFEDEQIQNVSTSTDLWGVLSQSPGIRMRGYDVGGSHKATQTEYESFGIRGQNRVISDGVDSTEGTGGAGFYNDFYSVEEFRVSAAGADVEMTSPGASVVMTVKSGGEDFSGLVHLDYEGEGMVGENVTEDLAERGFGGEPNLLLWEGHADLGGPIAPERAWFYGAYNHFRLNKERSNVDPAIATEDSRFDNYTGKIKASLSEKDRLIGYSQWGKKLRLNIGLSTLVPAEATSDQDTWTWVHKLEWQRSWSGRLFSTVQLAHFGLSGDFIPNSDPLVSPRRLDLATGEIRGSPGSFEVRRFKPHVRAHFLYYLPAAEGGHDLKWGFEWQYDKVETESGTSTILYFDDSDGGRPHNVFELGFGNDPLARDAVDRHLDFYVQDRFTLTPRLTLTAGARFSHQRVFHHDVELMPQFSEFFDSGTVPGQELLSWFDVAPRLGAVFALDGESRNVLRASFGRYTVNLADTLFGANAAVAAVKVFTFLDPNETGSTMVQRSWASLRSTEPPHRTPSTPSSLIPSPTSWRSLSSESGGAMSRARSLTSARA